MCNCPRFTSTAGVCLILICLGSTAHAMKPRNLPTKPAQSVVPPGYDRSHIEVKFMDGLEIGLNADGAPVSLEGTALMGAAAQSILSEITMAGGTWGCVTGTWGDKIDELVANAEQNLGKDIADLNNCFVVSVPVTIRTEDWLDQLNLLPEVEIALAVPFPASPLPPDFQPLQGYLRDATEGIGAESAWLLPGGTGAPTVGDPVRVCDFENDGVDTFHQDFPFIHWMVPPGDIAPDPDINVGHGTAVQGVLLSLNNGWGTTGCAYGVEGYFAPVYLNGHFNPARALTYAMTQFEAGDVFLIELETPGPNFAGGNEFGYVAMEWSASVYAAVQIAIGNGIHVVACAGNGDENFDDPVYDSLHAPFKPENNSGAIFVGAGAALPVTDVYRSRIVCGNWASNWGSRLDLQAWGEGGVTTGGGTLYWAEDSAYYYREIGPCGGATSYAGPMVASAVAMLESIYESRTGGATLPPLQMRDILKWTGSPQQAGSRPVTEHIGPCPDVPAAARALEAYDVPMPEGDVPGAYYCAAGSDYAPAGVPDFDQKQRDWMDSTTAHWTWSGPTALANAFWWLDSQPYGDSLLDPYGAWGAHSPENVPPFITDLAGCMQTDVSTTGSDILLMRQCVEDWLVTRSLDSLFGGSIQKEPELPQIVEWLEYGHSVVLLLGFWEYDSTTSDWWRSGGHYVTCAGASAESSWIAISDPWFDWAEKSISMHLPDEHNDAAVVSGPHGASWHDRHRVDTLGEAPGGAWRMPEYPIKWFPAALWNFEGQNCPAEFIGQQRAWVDGPVHTEIEYALTVAWRCLVSLTGDVNLSETLTSADIIYLVNYVFKSQAAPMPCDAAGDVDCSGQVTSADIIYMVNHVFKGGAAPCDACSLIQEGSWTCQP